MKQVLKESHYIGFSFCPDSKDDGDPVVPAKVQAEAAGLAEEAKEAKEADA